MKIRKLKIAKQMEQKYLVNIFCSLPLLSQILHNALVPVSVQSSTIIHLPGLQQCSTLGRFSLFIPFHQLIKCGNENL